MLQQQKYKEAIEECEKSLELNKNYGKAYFRRAEAKMELEDYEGAVADYT